MLRPERLRSRLRIGMSRRPPMLRRRFLTDRQHPGQQRPLAPDPSPPTAASTRQSSIRIPQSPQRRRRLRTMPRCEMHDATDGALRSPIPHPRSKRLQPPNRFWSCYRAPSRLHPPFRKAACGEEPQAGHNQTDGAGPKANERPHGSILYGGRTGLLGSVQ